MSNENLKDLTYRWLGLVYLSILLNGVDKVYKKFPFYFVLANLAFWLGLQTASAIELQGIYAVASAGYVESDVNNVDDDDNGFGVAVGYQFHRQWYAEIGFKQLASGYKQAPQPGTVQVAENFSSGTDASTIYLSVLGKARGTLGELYYRLSVMNLSVQNDTVSSGNNTCDIGNGSQFQVSTGEDYTLCEADESTIAAGIGLGFDFNVSKSSMVRFEFEHIRGKSDIQLNTITLGYRYNF